MGNISDRVKAELTGTTLGDQIAARKALPADNDSGADAMRTADVLVIKQAAAAMKPGVTQIDSGSQAIEDMKIASAAKGFTVKAATTKWTQAQIDAEAGFPNAEGAAAMTAVMRLNRKQGGK
jgi:hypothetical protein